MTYFQVDVVLEIDTSSTDQICASTRGNIMNKFENDSSFKLQLFFQKWSIIFKKVLSTRRSINYM